MISLNFDRFENKHINQRCFILGNSPSLASENLDLLKNEIIFTVNRGYLAKEIGLSHSDYYVLTDIRVYENHYKEIKTLAEGTRFYSTEIERCEQYNFYDRESYVPIFKRNDSKEARKSLDLGIYPKNYYEGWGKTRTVVLDAAIIAHFMGFKEIYLLGVDFDYNQQHSHFYSSYRHEDTKGNPESMLKGLESVNTFLSLNNKKFVNLSSGFKYANSMNTSKLESVLN